MRIGGPTRKSGAEARGPALSSLGRPVARALVVVCSSSAAAAAAAAVQPGVQELVSYTEVIPGIDVSFDMVAVPGGSFPMGSPAEEPGWREDEGPVREVEVSGFWIGRHEVSWDEYRPFMLGLDRGAGSPDGSGAEADAVTRPTAAYVPMDFGMGVEGFPAVAMTQFAARQYTRWLSARTGRFYRLATEAEWEYVCLAGRAAGVDVELMQPLGWHAGNSGGAYRKTGELSPNGWGVHDMLGNVAEWVLDAHAPYGVSAAPPVDPIVWPESEWGRVVRGGSFADEVRELRCSARRASVAAWKRRDPQLPKSIWYLTDAPWVGLRVVRPLEVPAPGERERFWLPDVPAVARAYDAQSQAAP
jgi:formylglycine-generating enzyme required for sulfatase activity